MILPPTGADPIAGSGLAPYFQKRKKSLVRCALRTASDGVCGRNISLPSASDAAAALPVAELGPNSAMFCLAALVVVRDAITDPGLVKLLTPPYGFTYKPGK